jgi:general L-amino acid transport system permease protein
LRVALVGIVGATMLGTLVGIGRLSRNVLVRGLCGTYVEFTRNVPLLLQLYIWYFLLTETLPPIEEALRPLPGLFFSKNGLQFPVPVWAPGHWGTVAGAAAGLVLAAFFARWAGRRRETTGRALPVVLPGLVLLVAGAAHRLAGPAVRRRAWTYPEKTEINVVGGGAVTPGVPDGAVRADHLHRRLHRRSGARRHPVGGLRPA